jgi:hypothetical protein
VPAQTLHCMRAAPSSHCGVSTVPAHTLHCMRAAPSSHCGVSTVCGTGKRLIELYAAQISAALRPCIASDAEPALAFAGCAATSRYLLAIASSANDQYAARGLQRASL